MNAKLICPISLSIFLLALSVTNVVAATSTDLTIGQTASASNVIVGQSFSFTLSVTNLGPLTATSITVQDVLPAGLTLVSSTGSGTYNSASGIWSQTALLSVGGISRMTITVQATNAGTIVNTATIISSNPSDSNAANNTAAVSVTVNPIPPIVLTCSSNITAAATGQSGTVVFFTVTASGGCSPPTVVANPPSGSKFPIGTTTVNTTAHDTCGNVTNCSFTVTVVSPPIVLTCSSNITVTASGPSGAVVFFTCTASGGCSPPTVVANPPSGSTFPPGTTTVNTTASDACSTSTSCSFTVTVISLPPIVLNCSSNITATATGQSGAVVFFTVAASGGCNPPPFVTANPPSGSTFPIGTTTVNTSAHDTCGDVTNCSFTVTVASPPLVLTCSSNITVTASGSSGAVVFFTCTASGGCNPPPYVIANPPSGSTFPIGTTTVTTAAGDACGNNTNCSFTVTVNPPPTPTAPEYFFTQPLLPPVGSVDISTATYIANYANGIVIRDLRHRFFTQNYPLPPLGTSQTETFNEEVDFDLSTDNGVTFQPVSTTANVTMQVTHTQDVGNTMFFDTEMLQLDISGVSLPGGMMFRESPTLHSTGQTTVRPVAGGYMISSFFDIFTELSTDGGISWQPAQQAGHVEMHPDPKQVTPVSEPTQLLPPPNGVYVSPQQWFALFAQGIVVKDVRPKLFTGAFLPPALGVTNTENFNLQVDLQVSTDGGNTFQYVRVAAPAQMLVAQHGSSANPIYDTELTLLSLNLPSGVMIRESPTEPSRGQVEIDPQADGTFRVSSFFDIFTELSLDGGASWSPATNGPARMDLTTPAPEMAQPVPNLPPAGQYVMSPANYNPSLPPLWFTIYANGIIITNPSFSGFSQSQPPPAPGTSQTESFGLTVSGQISMNGGASFTPFSAPATASIQVNSRAYLDTGSTRFFDTEMLSLNLSGGTLPGGIMVRESPTKASLGRTSVRTNAPGDYRISSFFDIFTEVSLDGGQTWSPSVITPGTVGLTTNTPVPTLTVTCSSNITATAAVPSGALVNYTVTSNGGCAPVNVVDNPPSGSTFPIGTTTVTVVATDGCGQNASCQFTVTVNPPPTPTAPEYFNPQALLPPPNFVYTSPAQWFVLFAQGIVIRDVRHRFFTQNYPLPPLGTSQTETFNEEVDFDLSTDNGVTFQPVSTTANVTMQVTHTQDVGNTMFFDTEMLQLDISGVSLPGGMMFRESPTLHSTGQTTVRPVAGGYMISSFFDIFTELSTDGGISWQPAQQAGHVEMHPDPKQVTPVSEPTQLLPPPNGVYVSPQQWFALFAQGIVVKDVRPKLFTGAFLPPALGVTNTENFNLQVDLQVSTDGGNTFQYVRVAAPAQMLVAQHGSSANPIYDTELTLLSLNLPSGVMIRESPTEPSRGQVEIDPQADGTFRVSSFFDIFTELSLDGGASWSPATNGPARMDLTTPAPEMAQPVPNLPPAGQYVMSPANYNPSLPPLWFTIYANGIIITNPSFSGFSQSQPPPAPGTSQTESFGLTVSGQISMNGGASFTPFSAPATASIQVNSRAYLDTGSTRFFDTEMLSLNLSGGTLPGGIMVRESPTKASLGRTSVRTNAPGDYRISSFFDIFTEVSLDGGQTWSPSVITPGTVGLTTNTPVPTLTVTCSSNITATAAGSNGAVVFFTVTASGGCSPPPFVSANPPSGSTFPIGTTTVTVVATDDCGQNASCQFTVTVNPVFVPQLINPIRLGNGNFQFTFTNSKGALFTILATTNISLPVNNWVLLGPATEVTPGQFQYTDSQATSNAFRFYRVRWP